MTEQMTTTTEQMAEAKIRVEIKNRWTGDVIYAGDLPSETPEDERIRLAVEKAVRDDVSLREADLCDTDLSGGDFRGADLRGALLRGCDLCGANFRGARLEGADLRYTDCRSADFDTADLDDADLRYSDLRGACGYEALRRGTRFDGARFGEVV